MANFILGQMDTTIATFSFDGPDAGKIVLASRFDGNGVRWDYSINGKEEANFKEIEFTGEQEHKWQLTPEEIAAITSEKDIYVHIVGVNYSEENLYKIDIQESAGLPDTLFASDLENKMLGAVDSIQWKYKETDAWKYYGDIQPELTGDKTVILRMGATGTHLASNTSTTYTFTEDVIDKKRKYIPVSHLSLHAVSTEATGANEKGNAIFALDGNYNTRWHSDYSGGDKERYITVKLDQPYNISAVEFVPAGGGNGKIYDGTVWGSMDGENWFILSQKKGLTYTNQANTLDQVMDNIKSFDIDAPQKVQYVKIVADRTNGNWFTARAFNFYEDTTIKNVASFSFDGAHAGVISLYDEFKNTNWKYSLDGGTTWKSANEDSHQLTQEEIGKININTMIKVKFDNDNEIYTITIKQFDIPESGFLNDYENIILNQPNKGDLEWKFDDEMEWHSYQDEEPGVVDGNKTLLVRRKASGISMASKPLEYKFTDNNTEKETYIPIKHLSIHGYSSQSLDSKRPHYAPNAIDGNINTEWHTDFSKKYTVIGKYAYIIIKLDNPRYISAIDYFHMDPEKEAWGYMKNAVVSVSEDGENWLDVANVQNVPQEDLSKHISFDESAYGQYVKISMESHDGTFATAAMINIYEDLTKVTVVEPEVELNYSTTKLTNQNVVVTLSSKDDIEIINNNHSNTYTFTQNGEFTFKYRDKANKEYSIKAVVKNIDKEKPTATIGYSTNDKTEGSVVATLKPSEKVTVLGNGGKTTYTFTQNGEFTFEFVDGAGNKGTATAKVTWIEKKQPDKPDDKPDDNTNSNTNTNKPTNGNTNSNFNTNKPTNGNINSNTNTNKTGENTKPTTPEETYKELTGGNVTVKVPNSIFSKYEDASLDYKKLTLSDAQKNHYGKDSEIYEVSLETKDKKEINLSNTTLTQKVKLDSNKKFDGIYVVKENGSVVKLDAKVNNGEAVFENKGLGKYIVSYKSEDSNKVSNTNSNDSQLKEAGKSFNYIPYAIGGVAILLVGVIISFVVRKKNDK